MTSTEQAVKIYRSVRDETEAMMVASIASAIFEAIAEEREACAKVADNQKQIEDAKCLDIDGQSSCEAIADAIRKRPSNA